MEENTRVRGLYSVVKFIDNVDSKSPNRLITMTLGKYGFVNSDYRGPAPNHDEFWLARIDREIKANSVKGCFVLTPVKPINRRDITTLIPGVNPFKDWEEDGIRYILPADREKFFVAPLEYRKAIKSVRSVIVVNFMFAGFGNSERYFYFPQEVGYNEEQQVIKRLRQTPYDGISHAGEAARAAAQSAQAEVSDVDADPMPIGYANYAAEQELAPAQPY